MGSGVSSSAALECAVLGAIVRPPAVAIDRIEQARIAQRAENDYVGAPTGLMDQLAALFGEPRQALLIDFGRRRSSRARSTPTPRDSRCCSSIPGRRIAMPAASTPPGAPPASGRPPTRCLITARRSGPGCLGLAAVADPVDARRARHILTDNQRVLDVVAALRVPTSPAVGRLLTASHASMRDDFEITTEHIDLIADTAVRAGALGARMTGGGFGGCVIALVPAARVDAVADAVRRAMSDSGHPEPTVTRTRAGTGAGQCP